MKNKAKFFATLGPIGYLRPPGTMASIFSLPIVYFVAKQGTLFYLSFTAISLLLSFFIIQKALPCFKEQDPPQIVLDELVGMLFTFLFVNINVPNLFLGLLWFRTFDILKPAGIRAVEKIGGSYGIVLDDVLAGILAAGFLYLNSYA